MEPSLAESVLDVVAVSLANRAVKFLIDKEEESEVEMLMLSAMRF